MSNYILTAILFVTTLGFIINVVTSAPPNEAVEPTSTKLQGSFSISNSIEMLVDMIRSGLYISSFQLGIIFFYIAFSTGLYFLPGLYYFLLIFILSLLIDNGILVSILNFLDLLLNV